MAPPIAPPMTGTISHNAGTFPQIKIKTNGMLLTQKVVPETATFESTSDTVYATGGLNNTRLACFTTAIRNETNIQFVAVPMDNKQKIYAEMRKAD